MPGQVKGAGCSLYRAVDKTGQTIDFLLTEQRDERAAKRFLTKAIRKICDRTLKSVFNFLSAHGCVTSGVASSVTHDAGAVMGGSKEGTWDCDGDEVEMGVDADAVRSAS